MNNKEIKIIVATHKKYEMPQSDIYLPVHVGAEGKLNENGEILELGYIKDNTGDNISEKNAFFCELTGLYWAWKNLDCDYLGLAHYRRHFVFEVKSKNVFENVLNKEEANKLLEKYKVIVPKKRRYYIETLYSHYAHTHYAEHLDITRQILEERYRDYVMTFDDVMKQTSGYMFNMMIMEKHLIDDYCSWLFDILFELEKRVDSAELSFFQGRFFGRVSEIMFNVWLKYQVDNDILSKTQMKEISYVYMEKIAWNRKITSFLNAKFRHKKYEGSF